MKWQSNFFEIEQVKAHYVDSLEEINAVLSLIENSHSVVFVDTEFLRETTYWPILCLLQIRVGDDIFCIDTLQEDCQEALVNLCSLDVTWVLHAAKQDLEIFYLWLGYVPERVFDTQIAAELCGIGEQLSYGALVEHFAGIELDKSQTRTRWDKRPLSQAQLVYAAEDVAYLPTLYHRLNDQLKASKRETWLAEEQMKMRQEIEDQADPNNAHIRMRRGGNFSTSVQVGIKALSIWREQLAVDENRPRTRILTDDDIYTLSFKILQKGAKLNQLPPSEFKNHRLVDQYKDDIEKILNDVKNQLQQVSNDNEKLTKIWSASYILTKAQKQEIKNQQQILEDFCESKQLILSRFARKKDLINWLFENESGRLSKGWRKQFIREHNLFSN